MLLNWKCPEHLDESRPGQLLSQLTMHARQRLRFVLFDIESEAVSHIIYDYGRPASHCHELIGKRRRAGDKTLSPVRSAGSWLQQRHDVCSRYAAAN